MLVCRCGQWVSVLSVHSNVLVKLTVLVFCCRLMLMALYNVSISVKGLKYIIENPGLMPLIWTLLNGKEAIRKQLNSAPLELMLFLS